MIENAAALATSPLRRTMLDAIGAGIEAATPRHALGRSLSVEGDRVSVEGEVYDLGGDVLVLGGGNVAGDVAAVLSETFDLPIEGRVVSDTDAPAGSIRVDRGDHPLPSERNVEATRALLERADAAGEGTVVLCVIGGGGSALLAAPAAGIPLADYREAVRNLLRSGADVGAINTVRKHCSAIKGGRLAETLAPAPVLALVFSDVVGDDLGTIASGPLWPDETTFEDALAVLEEHDVTVPESVRAHLEAGARGERPDTQTAATGRFDHVDTHTIAGGATAIDAASRATEAGGYRAEVLSASVSGPAAVAGRRFARLGRSMSNAVTPSGAVGLAGGETTVTVTGEGTGGPSQAFALAAALDLAVDPPAGEIVVASVDTDGIDGASDAAGAIVDESTVDDLDAARDALAANDAGTYLEARDALIRTGPTGTNVNDLYLVGVESP